MFWIGAKQYIFDYLLHFAKYFAVNLWNKGKPEAVLELTEISGMRLQMFKNKHELETDILSRRATGIFGNWL